MSIKARKLAMRMRTHCNHDEILSRVHDEKCHKLVIFISCTGGSGAAGYVVGMLCTSVCPSLCLSVCVYV